MNDDREQQQGFRSLAARCQRHCNEYISKIATAKRERLIFCSVCGFVYSAVAAADFRFERRISAIMNIAMLLLMLVSQWILWTLHIRFLRSAKMEWAKWRDHWNFVAQLHEED